MSEAMKKLQQRVGVVPDGEFGPNTARAIREYYKLTAEGASHLLGQSAHESGMFRLTRENLSYSVEAMMRVWPRRFPNEQSAAPYERNPRALANKVYANRMGNGENDGHVWIGRGFLQLTGRDNYKAFASDMRIPEVLQDPSLVEEEYAFETALWYFNRNNLFSIANRDVEDETIKKITKQVNGGYHGLEERKEYTRKIYGWLKTQG